MSNFLKFLNGRPVGTAMVLADLPTIANNTALANISGSSTTPSAVSLVSTATASTIMLRDTNANTRINNLIENFTTTATAAGTTTLTVSSTYFQQFTGTTTQTVVLPDATTLVVGQAFAITNRSTGTVTVNANGGGLIQTMVAGSQTIVTVTSIGTSAGTWDSSYSTTTGGGGGFANPMTTLGDIITGGSGGTAQRTGIGTPGQVLTTVSGVPAWNTPSVSSAVPPTVQKFLSGSGTYTTPSGVLYIRVRMVGGGGGSAGGAGSPTSGGAGSASTFGTSLLSAGGGGAGTAGASASGGAGGTSSLGTGPIGTAITGGSGSGGFSTGSGGTDPGGPNGGSSALGGGGAGGGPALSGGAGAANTGGGAGGGGCGSTTNTTSGGGGGAGGFIDAIITNPTSTYSYVVGTGGTAGTGGTNGAVGGSGYIEVTEYYSSGSSTAQAVPPTIQKFLSGSGTYNTPAGVLYIQVEMVGPGGGGAGNSSNGSNGSAATTFGTASAGAGSGAIGGGNAGGAGGSATLGTGAIGLATAGTSGNTATNVGTNFAAGGNGGSSVLGGGGVGGFPSGGTGGTAVTNSGSGGGGVGGVSGGATAGSGGGSGGYVKQIIISPSSSYSYAIGSGGAGGTSAGAGASGYIQVTEFYSSGGTTVWGGVKNYLSYYIASTSSNVANAGNGNFELATTAGWSLAHSTLSSLIPTSVASATVPFSSTSGGSAASGNLSLSLVSSGSQIGGNYSGSLASSAASTAGDMLISNAFYIDKEDQAKVQTVKFYYNVNSGAANLNFSGTSSNSFALWIYDVTNAAWIMPAGVYNTVQSSGTGYCTATFQTTSNSTQYQLALININASAGAYTLYLDDFYLGPQTAPMAPAMSDPIAYTPTITGLGSVTGVSFSYTRNGKWMNVVGNWTSGTAAPSLFSVSLPSGLTIDTNFVASNTTSNPGTYLGIYGTGGGGGQGAVVSAAGTSTSLVYVAEGFQTASGVNSGMLPVNGNAFSNNTTVGTINFWVPIAGWSSNSVASSDTDTRVVAACAYASTNYAVTTNQAINFDTSLYDTHGAISPGASNTWKYTIPVSGFYNVNVQLVLSAGTGNAAFSIYKNGSMVNDLITISDFSGAKLASGSTTAKFSAGDTISINPNTGVTVTGTTSTALYSAVFIERLSGPAVITATETVAASYSVTTAQNTGGAKTVINFNSKDIDTHNAVTTGSSWIFTAPISGTYSVSSQVAWQFSASTTADIYVFINGSQYCTSEIFSTSGDDGCATINTLVKLNAGDTVQIQAIYNGGTQAIIAVLRFCSVNIHRVGN